jgi:hypothetical protein
MNGQRLLSDQLYMWSDSGGRRTFLHSQKTPQTTAAQTTTAGVHPARLANRALQTLRQARVQMRQWSRTRSQVLSVGELSWQSATDGLRSAGRSRRNQRAPRQLPSGPRDLRGDLRDQPRIAAAPRGALNGDGEPGSNVAQRSHRLPVWRRAPRQHARGLARRRARVAVDRGERR